MELRDYKEKNLYTKIIGCYTKKGNISASRRIFFNSVTNVAIGSNIKAYTIIITLMRSLGLNFDVRNVNVRKNSFTVPVPVNSNRFNFLVVKKLRKAMKLTKTRVNSEKKFTLELDNIVKSKATKSMEVREADIDSAVKNQGNIHFRW